MVSSLDSDAFASEAVRLHEDGELWQAARNNGRELLGELFDAEQRRV